MKRLILQKLIIISQRTQEAKIIEFDKKLTIITGDNPDKIINRTGKSLVMKSIYYALGVNLKKITSNWTNLQLCTIISFSYRDIDFELYRNGDRFLLRSGDRINRFDSISDLREYYVEFFNFKIKLPIALNDANTVNAYPGAIFMPFYVDQDIGWSGKWDSFSDVFSGKWKSEILLYHMGIRTPQYYTLLDEKVDLDIEQKENKRQENTLNTVVKKHVSKYGDYLDINVDLGQFAEEIAELTNELNSQLEKRNSIKEELVKCFNEMREFDELYSVAQKNYNELLADIDYVNDFTSDDTIICPICGTSHNNNVENKFNLYSEIEECEETMQSYFAKRSKIENRIERQSRELEELEVYIQRINSILERKRESITFKDIVISEGSKSILEDMRTDLTGIMSRIFSIEQRLSEISKAQSAITREGKSIGDLYLEKLKINLGVLDVNDIDQKDLEKISPSFKSGGNDLPCAILAQIYAIYEVALKYSHTVTCPIVLDAIFQQEPAKKKIQTIWEFLINNQPSDSQLVISTTEMHGFKTGGKIISLVKERGLFNQEDYQKEKEKITWYKSMILSKSKE